MSEIPVQKPYIARQDDIAYIVDALADGECCSIVGMSNIGKSFLLRSLRHPEVRRRFLGDARDNYILVYVDFNLMWEMTDQGFYEVILRGITSEVEHLAPDEQTSKRIRESYQKLINPSSPFLIPVSFNEGLMALNPGWERRLVLLFDEFDAPWANIDRRTYLNLRALRDRYQENLCYVTATVHPLAHTRPGREIVEFIELFTHHTRYLTSLLPLDSLHFIRSFSEEEGVDFRSPDVDFVQSNADGHPGLLEATCHVVAGSEQLELAAVGREAPSYDRVQEILDSDDVVRTECAKLWNDLSDTEQETLISLVSGRSVPDRHELTRLQRKRIITRGGTQPAPFCRLFESFVRRQGIARQPERRGIRIDVESGDVWIDGRQLPALTDLEYRLMLLLYGNIDKICDKYKIVENVWGEHYIDQVDDARIEKLVSRLRHKLGEDPSNPSYLVTLRGRGYKLSSSNVM